jgi:hypothetical protein
MKILSVPEFWRKLPVGYLSRRVDPKTERILTDKVEDLLTYFEQCPEARWKDKTPEQIRNYVGNFIRKSLIRQVRKIMAAPGYKRPDDYDPNYPEGWCTAEYVDSVFKPLSVSMKGGCQCPRD